MVAKEKQTRAAVLDRPRRETAADQAAEALLDAIVTGAIPPGAPLRLQEVSEQLGMSMMPVREAIRRLEALDLVEVEPHKGAWVREMSLEDLEETYYARLWMECLATGEAVARFTDADRLAAEAALAERARAIELGNRVAARNAHERFHFTIYEASGRPWLTRSMLPAWRNSERYRVESMRHPELLDQRAGEHEAILQAVLDRDVQAAVTRLYEHLHTSVTLVVQRLDPAALDRGLRLPALADLLAAHGGKRTKRHRSG